MAHGGFGEAEILRQAARVWLICGWRDRDLDRLRAIAAPDFRYDLVGREDEVGLDWYLGFLRTVHNAVTDLTVEIQDLIVDGDDAGVHLSVGGRQTGQLFGVPPRGATGSIDAMVRIEFRGRRVARQSTILDFAALQRVLGG